MEQKLRRLNVQQIKFIAKELKIKGRSSMFKDTLINELEKFTDVDIDKLITKAIIMYNYPCVHGIKKYFCKECEGSQICIHEQIKYQCKECVGTQICIHRKRKCYCILCDGSQICAHNKQKSFCKECGGSQICEHGKQKASCKECGMKIKNKYKIARKQAIYKDLHDELMKVARHPKRVVDWCYDIEEQAIYNSLPGE